MDKGSLDGSPTADDPKPESTTMRNINLHVKSRPPVQGTGSLVGLLCRFRLDIRAKRVVKIVCCVLEVQDLGCRVTGKEYILKLSKTCLTSSCTHEN